MYKLRDYQIEAKNSIFSYFAEKSGNPLVAMPTGTGKSVVIAAFVEEVLKTWPGQRIAMLTHVKELIQQNAQKMRALWPEAPIGIYSAGMKSRESTMPILFGGVQSVVPAMRRGEDFGHRDLLLIDEAHLLGEAEDSFYRQFIKSASEANPNFKVIGFTATPFRSKVGLLTNGSVFTDFCFDVTDTKSIARFIREGYMAPLVGKATSTQIDTSNVAIVAGEFSQKQLEEETSKNKFTEKAIEEALYLGADRSRWLVFTTGIANTELAAGILQSKGLEVLPVHSKLPAKVNDERLEAFKRGDILGLVSGQKLTTGFDCPEIDLIVDLNATNSVSKHVQKLGRGTRPAPGKTDCTVLDFGTNIKRLGPIDDPRMPRPGGKNTGDTPVRICEVCGTYNHLSAKVCATCGNPFVIANKITEAGSFDPMKGLESKIEFRSIDKIIYNLHQKENRPPMIKVSYFSGIEKFTEYVMLEHGGFAQHKSQDWWRQRHNEEPPKTTREALSKVSELRVPKRVKVDVSKKWPEVKGVEWL